MTTKKKTVKKAPIKPKKTLKPLSDREKLDLWGAVDWEGFGYYMLHYGPDMDAIERMGFDRKKVEEACLLLKEIETEIMSYEEIDAPLDDEIYQDE